MGAALDPLADKVLVATALILLIRSGAIHGAAVVAALIIVLREILVSGLREAVAKTGGDMPVTMLAKWKTTAQLAALGVLIAAAPGGFADPAWRPAGIALLWFAAILTAWTAISYTRTAVDRLNRIDGGRD